MGRRAQGIRFLKRGRIWCVRFRIAKQRHEYSTGVQAEPKARRPSEAAVRAGEQIYAAALQGKRIARAGATTARAPGSGQSLAESFAEWLDDLTVREPTRAQYEVFTVQWLREWKRAAELTEANVAAYFRGRLREVLRKSVANEASALRSFSTWAVETGALDAPIAVPTIPKSALGKRFAVRRRVAAPELSAAEIEALLAGLPERSEPRLKGVIGFPIKARFEVMFDTTLRPATLDKLSVPEHWAPGEKVLRISADDDKEGNAREVPLTARALAALERVAPAEGLIFGAHKYHRYIGPVAEAVLSPGKAAVFTGQHVRSAAITRALERSSNLAGVMHLAGHKHASTTSRYVRPSLRAALDVIGAFSGEASGDKPKSAAHK
jgi:integrase